MDGTLAEIRMFAGNFAPRNWAFCMGQIVSIAQNTALFSLLGTTFGGNGQTTFALPDLRGRTAKGTGQGPGLAPYNLGEQAGTESVTLTANNLPAHTHSAAASGFYPGGYAERPASATSPVNNYHSIMAGSNVYSTTMDTTLAALSLPALSPTGGGQPVARRSPYLGMNYIICMFGIYPSRN